MTSENFCWAVCVSVVFACASLFSDRARGSEEEAQASASSIQIAMLEIIGAEADERQDRAIVEAVESQLSDLNVRVLIALVEELPSGDGRALQENARRVAEENGVTVVFWRANESEPGTLLNLYVSSPDGEWMIQRELKSTSKEGTAETLAIILRSALYLALAEAENSRARDSVGGDWEANPLTGYLDRRSAGPAPPGAALGKYVEPATPQNRPPLRFTIAYLFGITSSQMVLEHGLDLAAGVRITRLLGVFAAYTLYLNIENEQDGMRVSVWRHPLKLGFELEGKRNRWALAGSMAGSFDYLTWESGSVLPADEVGQEGAELQVSAVSALTGSFSPWDFLQIFASVGMEIFIKRPNYVAMSSGQRVSVYNPWAVQPMLNVGAFFNVM